MPEGKQYELVDGELVERKTGLLTSIVAGAVLRLIGNYVESHGLGWTPAPDCGYQCFPNAPGKVRRPDGSFVSRARLAGDQLDQGYVRIPPDLAVEVVSLQDLYSDLLEKVQEYLDAGVQVVWLVDPPSRTIHLYEQGGKVALLQADAELTGEPVLPGFRCRVADLFAVLDDEQDAGPSGA